MNFVSFFLFSFVVFVFLLWRKKVICRMGEKGSIFRRKFKRVFIIIIRLFGGRVIFRKVNLDFGKGLYFC